MLKENLAIHEAGHATMAFLLEVDIGDVCIYKNRRFVKHIRRHGCDFGFEVWDAPAHELMRNALTIGSILLAGPQADHMYMGGRSGYADDYCTANSVLQELPYYQQIVVAKAIHELVEAELNDNYVKFTIHEVAKELLLKKTINQSTLRDIFTGPHIAEIRNFYSYEKLLVPPV